MFKRWSDRNYVYKEKLLAELWKMYDSEAEAVKRYAPLTTEHIYCDGRRAAVVDLIAYIKNAT